LSYGSLPVVPATVIRMRAASRLPEIPPQGSGNPVLAIGELPGYL